MKEDDRTISKKQAEKLLSVYGIEYHLGKRIYKSWEEKGYIEKNFLDKARDFLCKCNSIEVYGVSDKQAEKFECLRAAGICYEKYIAELHKNIEDVENG